MRNETKRDVLVNAVDALADAQASGDNNVGLGHQDADLFMAEYEKALPDDTPVIPKDVSEWLTWCKRSNHSLKDALDGETRVSEDTFARAWVLGVWRLEETGEIVELDVEVRDERD